jgi:hypothetical protein
MHGTAREDPIVPRFAAGAALSFPLWLVLAPTASLAADPVAACQRVVGRASSGLVKKAVKAEQVCLEQRTSGALPAGTLCVDVGPSLAGISHAPTRAVIAAAVGKARAAIEKKCRAVDPFAPPPAGLGAATTCSGLDPACAFPVTGLVSLLDCLECTHVSAAQSLVAIQYFEPTDPVDPALETVLLVDVTTGADLPDCGAPAQPCRSIQQAVNLATSGMEIRVAAGTYTYDPAADTICFPNIGTTAVVCVLNKELVIRGGFLPDDWTGSDPAANRTVIDGAGQRRGVLVQRTAPEAPSAALEMEGFTVARGRVTGAATGGDTQTFAFGGGMLVDASRVLLRSMIVRDCEAVGGDTSAAYGGTAAGGGIALRAAPSGTALVDVTFRNNFARGGVGPDRGGLAVGGGLFVFQSEVTGTGLVFDHNAALAGGSPGSGMSAGERADAQGGAVAVQMGSNVRLENVSAHGNRARGGDAGADGGGGFGGALYAELATLTVVDTVLTQNVATGGDATDGGLGAGGGVMTQDSTVTIERTRVVSNRSAGGAGSAAGGAGGGGGVYLSRLSGSAVSLLANSIIAGNLTAEGAGPPQGGGGGGVFLQGVDVTLDHCTVAANRLGSATMQGTGAVLLTGATGTAATVRYSIVGEHSEPSGAAALHVQPGNALTLTRGIFSLNDRDTNAGGVPAPAGTITGLGTMLAFGAVDFASPGSPVFDYHLTDTSPAIDQATGSAMADDVDGAARAATPDIGADEIGD